MTRRTFVIALTFGPPIATWARQKYSGPRPPQKDLPYLLEGDRLIPAEVQQTTQTKSKEGETFSVPGTTSPARTPLPEPIFLIAPQKLNAEQLALYHLQMKEGRRDVVIGKKEDDESQNLRVALRKLEEGLYRIEATHMLEPGEYALSPQGDNTAFCFTVY
jgi:hypothetical protein